MISQSMKNLIRPLVQGLHAYVPGEQPKIAGVIKLNTNENPYAPSGRGFPTRELDALCRALRGVVILDEAYVDFASETALRLAFRHPHVLVARTFSKGYSLCFQRVGYFVGPAPLVAALDKIRDSYNVNGLGQIAALPTLDDLPYYRAGARKIIATRR